MVTAVCVCVCMRDVSCVCVARMNGYDKDYLKDNTADGAQGHHKLLRWSAKDVYQWVCGIELEEYASGLGRAGVHGALMVWWTAKMGRHTGTDGLTG